MVELPYLTVVIQLKLVKLTKMIYKYWIFLVRHYDSL